MKKFLSFAFALLLCISVSAQTTLTEAVNFESTAHNGEEIDLFEILDGGQYVLINFFYSTMTVEDKEVIPTLVDAYYRFGCNDGDVYFMEVSPTDTDASYSIGTWLTQFNIPYPTIHTKTDGDSGYLIDSLYNIQSYPTTILISPDHKITLSQYKPESVDEMVEYFATFGIQEYECGDAQTPNVSITKERIHNEDGQGVPHEASTKVFVSFRANAATESFYYAISESANLNSEEVIAEGTETTEKQFSHTFEDLKESTTYFVYAQAVDADGNTVGDKSVIETRTLCPGDEGNVEITITVDISATFLSAKAIPNESTSEYHFGFVKKEYYEESEENKYVFLMSLINDDYPFCEQETYDLNLEEVVVEVNTPYYVVAIGRNGEGEWFAPSLKEFMIEKEAGPAEVNLNVKATPTSATITATPNEYAVEFHYGLVSKAVFDGTGEDALVEQVRNDGYPAYKEEAASWTELTPETEYVAIGTAKNSEDVWGVTTLVHFTTPKEEAVEEIEANFNIYPNPAKSSINIESSLKGKAQVNIFDMTGRNVKQVSVNDMSKVSINVENLNKGVYFISIQQDDNSSIQKLVVE